MARHYQAGKQVVTNKLDNICQIEDTLTKQTMNKLIETLKHEDATFNDLLNCLETITSHGDACLLKMDGERSTGWTTIVLDFPSLNRESMRYDSSDFRDALIRALKEYVSVKGLDQ